MTPEVIAAVRMLALIGLLGCILILLDLGAEWAEQPRHS